MSPACPSPHPSLPPPPGLIQRLQHKLAPQGVKLALPGLEGVAEAPLVAGAEASEVGLPRLLALLCSLELNGNLRSELEQMVQQERSCLLQDPLLMGLLEAPHLRHCLDTVLENSPPGKIKVLEVSTTSRQNPVHYSIVIQRHSALA